MNKVTETKASVPSEQDASALSPANVIFRPMNSANMATFSGYKVMFIAGSKYSLRLILRKGDATVSVYVYPESVKYGEVKVGDTVTILAEQKTSTKDGLEYWNATALNKEE